MILDLLLLIAVGTASCPGDSRCHYDIPILKCPNPCKIRICDPVITVSETVETTVHTVKSFTVGITLHPTIVTIADTITGILTVFDPTTESFTETGTVTVTVSVVTVGTTLFESYTTTDTFAELVFSTVTTSVSNSVVDSLTLSATQTAIKIVTETEVQSSSTTVTVTACGSQALAEFEWQQLQALAELHTSPASGFRKAVELNLANNPSVKPNDWQQLLLSQMARLAEFHSAIIGENILDEFLNYQADVLLDLSEFQMAQLTDGAFAGLSPAQKSNVVNIAFPSQAEALEIFQARELAVFEHEFGL